MILVVLVESAHKLLLVDPSRDLLTKELEVAMEAERLCPSNRGVSNLWREEEALYKDLCLKVFLLEDLVPYLRNLVPAVFRSPRVPRDSAGFFEDD